MKQKKIFFKFFPTYRIAIIFSNCYRHTYIHTYEPNSITSNRSLINIQAFSSQQAVKKMESIWQHYD